ncbi:MAG: undecaprenyldiphospho-muramoylpentapeptide beta-N-acetylglucosaminyltransferase [Candidatus Omnitrophica bacterium]|nr:undecaprenyldiphospho-muramoylpentapeptide beta-N-acetylglucosaminyltransferase [Candidatus Omnitrophota bacterium]MDD5660975.1 undecaprenyldiphospho-muramoylpentapeptide beta-N-acetylglucosaminyltransferase [Candidatus Omnitrophota bacterium]
MRVLIASGSSGGHIFPALALINSLKEPSIRILLVLPQKAKENKIPVNAVTTEYIHTVNLTLSLSKKNILGAFIFLLAAWESLRIILRFKPEVVVGFGSLNTVALIFWAWLFRINTIVHEQNVIPGRANRLLSKIADKIAVSFIQTAGYLNVSGRKVFLVGNPVRRELVKLDQKEALEFFGFKEGKFNLLITGGSQGSHKLNTVVFETIAALKVKDAFQVVHISGSQDFAELKSRYASLAVPHKIFDFFPNMQYAYSASDLVICRAGATTIAELQKFAIPAVLVPYPYAYAHQLANARALEITKAAVIINDQELNVEKLSRLLIDFLENPAKLTEMRSAFKVIGISDAAGLLAKEVLSFTHNN